LLARDRFGQKPLYWAWDGNRFLFGSEIKSILALRQQPASLDMGALDDFLTLRFVPGPNTMFAGINKIPPASLLILDVAAGKTDGRPSVNLRRYWELQFSPKRTLSERAAISETRDMIREAVKIHMVSDVPIGAFLSGGLDSSTVVAMMSEQSVEPISTFAIGVQEEDFNELGFASELAAHCGTNHRQQVVSPNLVQLLPDIVWHMEEPSDPVATCMYHAAALARHHVKVVLTGDGGDEMFAGFDRYWGFEWVRYYAALPATLRRGLLGPLLRRLPDNAAYKNLTQKARWVHELSFHEAGRRYAEATVFFRFGAPDKAGLYTEETLANLYGRDPAACIARAFDSAVAENDLDRMLSADINTRLPQHSLMLTDRMTMAVGLEARAPLLDHRLAEEVATLAASIKAPGGSLKHLLREAAAPYLPQRTLHRPKQGFMFPLALWIKGPLAPVLNHLIENSALVAAGIFRREAMQQLMSEHLANQVDHHARLWMLLNLELWYRIYVLGVSRSYLTLELEELIRRGKR
jgi:asparagine synthase (glutamine-hydrolysing)